MHGGHSPQCLQVSSALPLLHSASQSGKQLCKLTSRGIHWVSSRVPSPTGCQNRLFTLHRWERKICLFGCNCQAKDVLSLDRNSSRVRAGSSDSDNRPGLGTAWLNLLGLGQWPAAKWPDMKIMAETFCLGSYYALLAYNTHMHSAITYLSVSPEL